jgi:hypothetical protein
MENKNIEFLEMLASNEKLTLELLQDFAMVILHHIFTRGLPEISSNNMGLEEAKNSIEQQDKINKKVDEVLDQISPYIRCYFKADIFCSNEIRKKREESK